MKKGDFEKLTVEKLMENAENLFKMEQYRASVLEAFTALEQRVADVIFDQLANQASLPQELIDWIKVKTKYRFEERLHPIGNIALGKEIDKGSALWRDYQVARDIRNKVSHTGRKVSKREAEKVLTTVESWLEFVQGAVDLPKAFHESEVLREFLSLYGILVSSFKPKGSVTTGDDYIDMAFFRATEQDDLDDFQQIKKLRNSLVHARHVDSKEIERIMPKLKELVEKYALGASS